MSKPAPGPSLRWTGTSGNDMKTVASLAELKNTVYDAGAGFDTLNLSALTSGVSISLSQSKQTLHSQLWADSPFHGSWWGYNAVGTDTVDSIKNFEKIVGTGFNDYINISIANVARVADGGAGDDSIQVGGVGGSSTAIGGLGSDQFAGGNANWLFIGGTYDGVHATPDNAPDEYFIDGGTILDFEVGIDRLYIDGQATGLWVDVSTSYGPAAQLTVTNGTSTDQISLVGVSASTMNALPNGYIVLNDNPGAQITSGAGDDLLWDHSTTATTYIFGANSGHDTLVGLDPNVDTLVFPAAPTATDATYHGDPALLLTFAGGQSVLLPELTTADLSHILMQYPTTAPATTAPATSDLTGYL